MCQFDLCRTLWILNTSGVLRICFAHRYRPSAFTFEAFHSVSQGCFLCRDEACPCDRQISCILLCRSEGLARHPSRGIHKRWVNLPVEEFPSIRDLTRHLDEVVYG